MISPLSRYATSTVSTRVVDAQGKVNPALYRTLPAISSQSFVVYMWTSNDRLDLLADECFGDPALWWVIMDLNPEITNPLQIESGTLIRIPLSSNPGWGT